MFQSVAFVLLSLASAVLLLGWLSARRAFYSAHALHKGTIDDLLDAREEIARLTALTTVMRRDSAANVRALVPMLNNNHAADPAQASTLRLAFRAWIMFHVDCPAILPFRDVLTQEMDDATRHQMLCELYARSIMECCFARYFDGADPGSDKAVLRQVRDSLGDNAAVDLHHAVRARGVVLRSSVTQAVEQSAPST